LYIQLEIEKRGVQRVQLELERDMALLKTQEAERKHKEGQVAFSTGAISELQLEKLGDDLAAERNNLLILEEKLAIASRPEPEEVLTEARLQMEQAEVRAQKARDLRDRALRLIDQKITVLKARLEKSAYEVEEAMRAFPEVLEFSITFLKEEIQSLDDSPEGVERRREIEASIAKLERDLAIARENPPNIGTSPFAGVVHLMQRWGRPVQTGDRVDRESVVAHVYPGTNLEVRAYLNETDFGSVSEGMDVEIVVPSLNRQRFPGTVTHASRVGKDKFDGRQADAWAGVTQFELRVRLDRGNEDLRPGMTAIVECEVDTVEDVLHLPREAVFQAEGGYRCLVRQRGDRVVERSISGKPFSGTAFVVEDGLAEGDTVLVRRRRSS
jgi:HlyD family secretion protein